MPAVYTAEQRARRLQQTAQWRVANPERVRELHRRWDQENREHANDLKLAWRQAHPGCRDKDYATPRRRRQYLFNNVKSRAKNVGIPFSLVFADIVWPERCPVFGTPIDYGLKGRVRKPNSPSFDRTDPRGGYTPDNVVIMSWRANELKRNATLAEVEMLMSYLRRMGVAPNG